jgi:hypothetical protein
LCTDAIDACHRAFMALDLAQPLSVIFATFKVVDCESTYRIEESACSRR